MSDTISTLLTLVLQGDIGPVSQPNAYYGLRRTLKRTLSKKGEVYPKRRPESPFSQTATIAILACSASISRN